MRNLYFIRHGQSQLNVEQRYAGQLDTPLTDFGRHQVELAARLAPHLDLQLIIASPLSRALETAHIIARAIGYPATQILQDEQLKERFLGSLQGKSWHEYSEDNSMFADLETLTALRHRAQEFLGRVMQRPEDNILIAGHGSFARELCALLDYDTDGQELPNAEIVQLTK